MNDERFFDLAMKVIARQAGDAEHAELDALLAREPELRAEFARLQADARVAKDALPLMDATKATTGEFPAYARGRLQTKVKQTLGRPAAKKEPDRSLAWGWRWILGLATATAVVLLVALPVFRAPSGPVIQVAMLDTAGATRGFETNQAALFHQTWQTATINYISNSEGLYAWQTNWPDKTAVVKIIYDRAAAEVHVLGRWEGKSFDRTFLVEQDLTIVLKQAKEFIREQVKP